MTQEKRRFEAETQKVLNLMIHSLYSNRDIFIRELVANASDAIDRARFMAIEHKDVAAEWQILIEADKQSKTLTIRDNGIGMTRDELIRHLGTIAHSGTLSFVNSLSDKEVKDRPELIGQFGVGFYSAFMAADKIVVRTKKAASEEPATLWESDGEGEYTVSDCEKIEQGTWVTLHLKPDAEAYLEPWKIREIVKKYSDFIEYPVQMERADRKPEDTGDKLETLNSTKALWLKSAKDVTDEECVQFFRHLSHSPGDYLEKIHVSAEGTTEFKALLFIPTGSPFNIFMPDDRSRSLSLYIRKVFITNKCPNLVPEWLRFIDGVVDSSDLPLNISRETLQDNPVILRMQKNIVRKILECLKNKLEDGREKYAEFFKNCGRFLKEGVHVDYSNKDKLQDLLLFETLNKKAGEMVTLKEYCAAMPASQKEIFYITGESRAVLENSSQVEVCRAKGFDVLLLTDPIDEMVCSDISKYEDKPIKSLASGELKFDDDDKASKEAGKELAPVMEAVCKILAENVSEVRVSSRLVSSPSCLVGGDMSHSPMMEKLMRTMNMDFPKAKRILEVNPNHRLTKALAALHKSDSSSAKIAEFAEMLYDQALLSEGSPLPDPARFSTRVADLMAASIEK